MSQSQIDMPPSSHIGKKRHRPKSLNLSYQGDKSNSDLALRIVSPGLPPLNEEMKTTVNISQQIEQQQRSLIAARQASNSSTSSSESNTANNSYNDLPATNDSNTKNDNGEGLNSNDASKERLTDELDRLATPISAKRLKRDNIPTPLNITSPNNTSSFQPSVQSAPIRQLNRLPFPVVSRQSQVPPRRYLPPIQQQTSKQQYQISPFITQMQRRQYKPFSHTQLTYSTFPPLVQSQQGNGFKRVRLVAPYTTTTSMFPKGIRNFQQQLSNNQSIQSSQQPSNFDSSKPILNPVTDVYHGDYTKAAPIQSQPLSAQREYMDSTGKKELIDDDRSPVSEQEIKEMQEKYRSNESKDENAGSLDHLRNGEIFGSINLMNESMFNFKIFSQLSSATTNGESSPNSTSSSSFKDSSNDDCLSKEKEKFLKICETSWDEFINSRKSTY